MGYSTFSSHQNMVFDWHRNHRYGQAIRDSVTADTVVLDLGAGLGIFGLIAAAAGARRVYLVEPRPVVQAAKILAEANGLSDKIHIFEGKIEDVTLPEKVDLIVSAFTGNLLFSEDLLPSLYYARQHFLKPNGTLLPDMAELMVAPVESFSTYQSHCEEWRDLSEGLDFSAIQNYAANELYRIDRKSFQHRQLSPPQSAASLDFNTTSQADCNATLTAKIVSPGICHGLLGWIRIHLGGTWLSAAPLEPHVHWSPVFFPLSSPMQVDADEEVVIKLHRPAFGDWSWTLKNGEKTLAHSTFLARLDAPRILKATLPHSRPGISANGQIVLQILTMMTSGHTNNQIAEAIARDHAQHVANYQAALAKVRDFAVHYGAHQTGDT